MRVQAPQRSLFWLLVPAVLLTGLAVWAIGVGPPADPELVWRRGEDALRAHRIDEAEKAARQLARLRTPQPKDWMFQAQVAMARNRMDEAVADLTRIPDSDPLGPQAHLFVGQLELRRSRLRAAEKALLEATRLDPKMVQPHRELIYIYGVQLRRPELNAQFRALSELAPLTFENAWHWCLTRNTVWEPVEIVKMMTAYLKADPDDRWSRLALAESLRQVGQRDRSEKVLSVLPLDDPEALIIRVRLALDRGDDTGAAKLLATGPTEHAELARLRGRMALAHHNADEALRQFRIAVRLDPDHRDSQFGMAGALTMLGRHDEAKPYLERSKNLEILGSLVSRASVPANRTDLKLIRQLGAACEAVHRYPEARAWYNLAFAKDPLDPQLREALFRVNAALSRTPKTGT